MEGAIIAVCVSDRRGQKIAVPEIELRRDAGIAGDVHAGDGHRQVSLLADERIETMRAKGLTLAPGAFGENLVTRGLALEELPLGKRLRLGAQAVVLLTQQGKECHTRCPIYYQAGDCIMPTAGLFARVVRGGRVRAGDRIATDAELDPVRVAILTLSDRGAAGERPDAAGPALQQLVEQSLGRVVETAVLPDERDRLSQALVRLCDEEICDLVLTTGGTGLAPRDITPEATLAVVDRQVPGMAEAMRAVGLQHTPHAMLSRAVVGQRGPSLIVNLSGSPRAAVEQLRVLLPALPHALAVASGLPQDCAHQPHGAPRHSD